MSELLVFKRKRARMKIIELPTNPSMIKLSHVCEAKVNDNEISIARRLPSRKPGERPIILRFAGRIGKLQLLKKQETTGKIAYGNGRLFVDLTAP